MAMTAVRWSGWLLVAGAALLGAAIVRLSLTPVVNQPLPRGTSALLLLSSVLLLPSLPAMYARQAGLAGWPGLAGFAMMQAGLLLPVIQAATPLLYPSISVPSGEHVVTFLLGIALTVGLLLTAVASLQAGVFPRWTAILLLTATVGFFFVFFIAEFLHPVAGQVGSATFGICLAVALAGIGIAMWTNPAG